MAAGDLCDLAEVKAWLEIPSATTTYDTLLNSLITRTSSAIKKWLSRPILEETYTESYNGSGTSRMVLRQTPVTAISSLTINGAVIPASTGPTAAGYKFYDLGIELVGGQLGLNPGYVYSGSIFPMGNFNVQVTYTAGYPLVPDDIRQAAIETVSFKFNQRKHIGQKTANIQAGGMGTAYQEGFLPPEAIGLLSQYKRVVPV